MSSHMKTLSSVVAPALLMITASDALGQKLPPVRQLSPATAATSEQLRAVSAVRHLSDGRLLVNDIIGRRVLLFDSTLKKFTVIADTTSATGAAYGPRRSEERR